MPAKYKVGDRFWLKTPLDPTDPESGKPCEFAVESVSTQAHAGPGEESVYRIRADGCPWIYATEAEIEAQLADGPGETYDPELETIEAPSITDSAASVRAERGAEYGGNENAFPFIAALWDAYIGNWLEEEGDTIGERHVADLMELFKMGRAQCRAANGVPAKRDDYVDRIAYAQFSSEFALGQKVEA